MVKSNIIKQKPLENPWVTYIKARIRDNQNFLGIFTGETGSGKTYSAVSVAEQIDNTFDVEKQLVFNFENAMKVLTSDWFIKLKWKILIWDEPQIEMDNQDWQSRLSKLINYLLSTFRHDNVILFWASPYKSFLNTKALKLVHAEILCKGWSPKTKLCTTIPRLQQYNDAKRRTYPHKLYVKLEDGGFLGMDEWHIKLASAKLLEIYEINKTNFTNSLKKDIIGEMSRIKEQKNAKEHNYLEDTLKFKELYDKYDGDLFKIQQEIPQYPLSRLKFLRNELNLPKNPPKRLEATPQ